MLQAFLRMHGGNEPRETAALTGQGQGRELCGLFPHSRLVSLARYPRLRRRLGQSLQWLLHWLSRKCKLLGLDFKALNKLTQLNPTNTFR